MSESSDLDVRVARALKAALDAEGVDFGAAEQDEDAQFEGTDRAWNRFKQENPDLIAEIRTWYLANYPPLREDALFEPDDHYVAVWNASHRPWWELVDEADRPTFVDAPPETCETDSEPWLEPKPWWDDLDREVGDAWLSFQEAEDLRAGQSCEPV
jgi:hypothetical protein